MLRQRIITALWLLILMAGMLFFAGDLLWFGFTFLIAMLLVWEYARLFKMSATELNIYLISTAALGLGVHLSKIPLPASAWLGVLLFWLVYVPLHLRFAWRIKGVFWVWLVGWMLALPFWRALIALRPSPAEAWRLLALMLLVWLADTAAFFVGRQFGRHPLAPKISPKKSIEGVVGACVAVTLYVIALYYWQPQLIPTTWFFAVAAAWLLTAVSIYGDLFESSLKRSANVKDSSQLLPGHGGVFDRVDSLLAVLAVALACGRLWAW